MPFYRFHVDVPLSPKVVSERLRFETLKPPGFFKSNLLSYVYWFSWFSGEPCKPSELFIGTVENNRFNIRCLNVRSRNPFLPTIRGRITPSNEWSHITILMYMNPFVAAFVAFWLFKCGQILVGQMLTVEMSLKEIIFWLAFFMAGFLLTIGIFFDGAFKAKKMLTNVLLCEDTKVLVDTNSLEEKVKCHNCGHFNANNSNKCLYCGADIFSV